MQGIYDTLDTLCSINKDGYVITIFLIQFIGSYIMGKGREIHEASYCVYNNLSILCPVKELPERTRDSF
jgi:hypothetical protein